MKLGLFFLTLFFSPLLFAGQSFRFVSPGNGPFGLRREQGHHYRAEPEASVEHSDDGGGEVSTVGCVGHRFRFCECTRERMCVSLTLALR